MSKSIVLRGADIKLYINGKLYKEVQQISYTINKGKTAIYGIDQVFPQEIPPTKVSVKGSVTGIRIRYSGGLQGRGITALIKDVLNEPYISLRITDRSTGEDILYVPSTTYDDESFNVVAKGIARVSFKFEGLVPFNPLDRSN